MSSPLWFYSNSDGSATSIGPFDPSAIRQLVAAGIIGASHSVRRDGEQEWKPLSEVDLDAPAVAAPALAPTPPPVPGYYLNLAGETSGPFPLSEIRNRLQRGEIAPATLAWTEGAPEWLPVSQVAGLGVGLTGPAVPVHRATISPPTPVGSLNPLPLSICVAVCALTSLFVILNQATHVADPEESGGVLAFLFLASIVGSVATWAVLHYRLWKVLPSDLRSISPGQAVALMFVPIFNLYWGFIIWPGLWRRLLDWQERTGLPRESDPKETSVILALLPCAVLLLAFLGISPRLRTFGIFGFLFCLCAFYRKATRIVEQIQARQPHGA